jgi:transposase
MTMIPPDVQAEILALHFGAKKGTRAIARKLGINRKAVRRVILNRKVSIKPESSGPRRSILDPFKPRIEEMLKQDPTLTSARILQQMRGEGYLGGYTTLKMWVAHKRETPQRSREAFLRIEFPPGETAQVDWGEFGTPFGDGVKVHCFLMVLCHSRLLYIEFTRSEKFEEFIRCHENAFKFFGHRVPLEIWYDNLASAVTERMGSLIRFNARFFAYLGHHGIRPHACNPARGNEKGRVEDGVKFVRSSFWAGRHFKNFEDLNMQAATWRDEFANKREHRSTRKIPRLHFEAEEKPLLRPMNLSPYDTSEVFSRVVPPSAYITYETNRYSVPWTLVGLTLTVRVNDREIKIYYHDQKVARHIRSYEKHQFIESHEHFKGLLERKPGATKDGWQIAAVKNIGPKMAEYLDLVKAGQRSLRHEVSRILALATVYGDVAVNSAVEELLKSGVIGVESLDLFLKSQHHPSEYELNPEPLQFKNPKLNRVVPTVDLRRFDALLFKASTTSGGNDPASDETHSTASSKEENHENSTHKNPDDGVATGESTSSGAPDDVPRGDDDF